MSLALLLRDSSLIEFILSILIFLCVFVSIFCTFFLIMRNKMKLNVNKRITIAWLRDSRSHGRNFYWRQLEAVLRIVVFSRIFALCRGTRQGNPWSLFLFYIDINNSYRRNDNM